MKRFLIPLLAALALPTAVNAENAFSTLQCDNKNYSFGKIVNLIKSATVTLKAPASYGSDEKYSIGVVIGKDDEYTYIISDSRSYKENPSLQVIWSDNSKDNVQLIYSFTKESYQPKENDLALFKYKGNKGSVIPIKQNLPILGSDIISVLSEDKYKTFNLINGIVEANKKYGTVLASNLDNDPLTSGSPLIDNNGCLVGIYVKEYEDKLLISNKQIITMLKKYGSYKKKINELIKKYPIKGDNLQWPSDWSNIKIEKESKSKIKPYATINFASSLGQACEVYKEAKKQEEFYDEAHDKVVKSSLAKLRSGEINREEWNELTRPTHAEHWPWTFKLHAAKVDLLRLTGHDDWQLYSRYSTAGVYDLLQMQWDKEKKDKNNIDEASDYIYEFYYWGLIHTASSDAICKKYIL